MFSFAKYNEIKPCIRGNELLTSILNKSIISKLWLSEEHIFLTTNEQANLYAFDIVPQLKWRRSVQASPNDCILETGPESVVEVIWDKSQPSLVLVVSETGTTEFWEFLRPSNEWIKHKTMQLSNAKGSQIIEIKWNGECGNLFWCERRGLMADTYCICYRSVNIRENVKIEIGSTQAILHNCPLVNIYMFKGGICIQPHQMYLEKILMFWKSGRLNVKAVVAKDGKVNESASGLSDFRDITTTLIGSWTENFEDDTKTWLGVTQHSSSEDLMLLDKSGTLFKAFFKANKVKLTPVCKLKLPSSNFEKNSVFSNGLIFGLIDCNSFVHIYDIVSGKLLQVLREFSSKRVQVLGTSSKHVIFWTSDGIWKLNCMTVTDLVKTVTANENLSGEILNGEVTKEQKICREDGSALKARDVLPTDSEYSLGAKAFSSKASVQTISPEGLDVVDVAKWLGIFGLKHSAMVLLLEHVISCTKKGDKVPETTLQFLARLGKEVLQNPAILLTVFEDNLELKVQSRNELRSFLDEIDHARVPSQYVTPLNLKILPFLRELHERWSEQTIVSSVDLSTLPKVVEDCVSGVIDSSMRSAITGATDVVALEKVKIIWLQEPEEAVTTFLGNNGKTLSLEDNDEVNNVGAVLRAELNDRRWKRRRSTDNATILGMMFQLLYKYHPEKLLDVLNIANNTMIEDGASKDESTLQDLQDCVREFMLDFLPNLWSEAECDLKRIKVHAQIFLRLGLTRDALAIFLQRQLWKEAVEFYVEITRSSTDVFEVCQLYEILLSSLLRGSGTSERELLIEVFEMKPRRLEAQSLFELCLKNVPHTATEKIFEEQSLTVGEAKKTLLTFLSKS